MITGIQATATSGNAVTTPVGGDFLGSGNGDGAFAQNNTLEQPRGFGFRFGASVAAEIGSYTNWGKGK